MATQPTFDFPPPLPEALIERISDAWRAGRMTDCESAVLLVLMYGSPTGPCAGRQNPLSISTMQSIWHRGGQHVWNNRSVKKAAKSLLEQHEIPVGSSRETPSGYYIVLDDEDAESTVRAWAAEIRSLANRCRALSPKSPYVRELLGQMTVEMDNTAP